VGLGFICTSPAILHEWNEQGLAHRQPLHRS
jgi:hypothetical protein